MASFEFFISTEYHLEEKIFFLFIPLQGCILIKDNVRGGIWP